MVSARIFLICISGLLAGQAFAETLTLSQALEAVHRSSLKTEIAESQWRQQDAVRTEALAGFIPTLVAQVSYLFDKRYVYFDTTLLGNELSIPQIVPGSSLSVTANWSVFDGLASTNRYQGAKALSQAAEKNFSWTRFQVEREIVVLFYRALAAKELELVAQRNLRALEDHLKDVKLAKKVGTSTSYDVLRAEVQQSSAQSELLNATDNVEVSRARLSEALSLEENVDDVAGALPQLSPSLLQNLNVQRGDMERMDLQALELKSAGLEYQAKAAGRHWVPRVSLFGQYQYYNNIDQRFDDWDQYRDAYQVGVLLTWNIFDGMSSVGRSRQSAEQRLQAEKSLRMARLKSRRDIDLWKRKFLYFCAVAEARQGDVLKAEESVRLAREGLKAGARTSTDVLDAEAELDKARAESVNAQLGALEAIVNLELSTGQKLVNF